MTSKTDVWVEFVALLRGCPTQLHRHTATACLLTHLFDDEDIDNQLLIDSIHQAQMDLNPGLNPALRKPCRSVRTSGKVETM